MIDIGNGRKKKDSIAQFYRVLFFVLSAGGAGISRAERVTLAPASSAAQHRRRIYRVVFGYRVMTGHASFATLGTRFTEFTELLLLLLLLLLLVGFGSLSLLTFEGAHQKKRHSSSLEIKKKHQQEQEHQQKKNTSG